MKSTTIIKFKWFWAWQDEKEESWLTEMAKGGFHLVKVTFPIIYVFRQGDPGNYIYRLDYQTIKLKNRESYFQLFEDAGWEYVCEVGGWFYFRNRSAEAEVPQIYSDVQSKIGKYQRIMTYLVILLPIFLILRPDALERFSHFTIIIEVIYAALILFYIFAMVQLFRRINQLKRKGSSVYKN